MTKKEHIKYWVDTANNDWKTVNNLFQSYDFVPALFFCHLHLEKICKALWVKNNKENSPPRSHNLIKILNESNVHTNEEQLDFMLVMNNFQLEGRYPDYKQKLHKTYKKENTKEIIDNVKKLSKWLQKKL